MQYNSVTDYFSQLHYRSVIFFFTPLLMFLALLYLLLMQNLTPVMMGEGEIITYAFIVFAFMDASMAMVVVKWMLKKVIPLASLGERMDKYAQVSLVRFSIVVSGAVLLMVALYLSGDYRIAGAYLVYLLFFLAAWPTRSRLCAELKLKENEKVVVFGK